MRVSLITKFAVRTLGRSVRRTLLSVVGIGIGCAIAVFIAAFMRGSDRLRVRGVAESGVGHLRVAPAAWEKSRDNELRLQDWQAELATVKSLRGIGTVAPHARATALLAFGTRVAGVEIVGVDPQVEQHINRLVRELSEGRYLQPGDRSVTVVGKAIAERLEVELDDDLLLSVVGEGGEVRYAMLRIVGIVSTGSRDIDGTICHVTLEDIEEFTGLGGAAELTITVDDWRRFERVASEIRPLLPEGDAVLTWKDVVPGIGGDMESDGAFMDLLTGIVIVMVVLGVTSAQLTAILERRREFAVLIALGMKSRQVIRLIVSEAVVAGVLGAALGLLLATPLVYHTATTGLDFAALMGEDLAISGVLFDPVFYSDMGPWMIPHALILALVSTLIAAIYPAWYALRTNPTSALSLREA
jgi:ABC-type lipoprotein release transport system permease subunit